MLRKGAIPTRFIMAMILGLLVTALIAGILMDSPLRDVIDQGNQQVKEVSGGPVVIDNSGDSSAREKLASLMRYTYHKAKQKGCMSESDASGDEWIPSVPWVNAEDSSEPGYGPLGDTWLGAYPDCFGAASTVVQQAQTGSISGDGFDQEGIFSRQRFRIPEDHGSVIKIQSELPNDNFKDEHWHWKDEGSSLNQHFLMASTRPYEEEVLTGQECFSKESYFRDGLYFAGQLADDAISFFGGDSAIVKPRGTGSYYVIYFEEPPRNNRPAQATFQDFENREGVIYCGSFEGSVDAAIDYSGGSKSKAPAIQIAQRWDTGSVSRPYVYLCPGDEGYVQVNRDQPHNEGEGSTFHTYPRLVITERGECGNVLEGPTLELINGESSDSIDSGDILEASKFRTGPPRIEWKIPVRNRGPGQSNVDIEVELRSGSASHTEEAAIPAEGAKSVKFSQDISGVDLTGGCTFDITLRKSSDGSKLDSIRNFLPSNEEDFCGSPDTPLFRIQTEDSQSGVQKVSGGGIPLVDSGNSIDFTYKIQNMGLSKGKIEFEVQYGDQYSDYEENVVEVPAEDSRLASIKVPTNEVTSCEITLRLQDPDEPVSATGDQTFFSTKINLKNTELEQPVNSNLVCGDKTPPQLETGDAIRFGSGDISGSDRTAYQVQVNVENPEDGHNPADIKMEVVYPSNGGDTETKTSEVTLDRGENSGDKLNVMIISGPDNDEHLSCSRLRDFSDSRILLSVSREGGESLLDELDISDRFCN